MPGSTGNGSETIKKTTAPKYYGLKNAETSYAVNSSIEYILDELDKASEAHPEWQTDPIHAAAVVAEEAGELIQAALDHIYQHCNHKDGDTISRMKKEAIQTGAMALRFLIHIDKYQVSGGTNPNEKGGAHEINRSDIGFFQKLKHHFFNF